MSAAQEPPDERRTVLVTLSGADRPGVTAAVFAACGAFPVEVVDIEQMVIRGRLVLAVLLTAPRDLPAMRTALAEVAQSQGLEFALEPGLGDAHSRGSGRARVTVLGSPLRPAAFAAVAGRVADTGANIDRIRRIARYPVTAVDLDVSGADTGRLQVLLATEAARQWVDIAVQSADIHRYAQRLVVLDVDSTLVQGEVIEMLAEHAGCRAEVQDVTDRAMRGELDFETSLRERVALLAGVPAAVIEQVYAGLVLTPGARTLVRALHRLGYRLGLVSGGFTQVVEPIAHDLGIRYVAANTLEIEDAHLTGRLVGDIVDRATKADALRRFAVDAGVPIRNTVAVGDGANDLDMLAAAGLGVAFNAKQVVREAADTAVSAPYLDSVAYLLGITREELEAGDDSD
ncbi:MAG: phosphoserine phosphatase SerB [Actinomycetota bacterium]|nr:phosphoserine phosphatase SerB [Actinomycetota bacterium]